MQQILERRGGRWAWWRSTAKGRSKKPIGLSIPRYFTRAGEDPFEQVEWEHRSAKITNEKGETVFEQTDVEVPTSWSQLATNVVAQKYFRGQLGTPEREHSVKQLIDRVVETAVSWGREGSYFADEVDADRTGSLVEGARQVQQQLQQCQVVVLVAVELAAKVLPHQFVQQAALVCHVLPVEVGQRQTGMLI